MKSARMRTLLSKIRLQHIALLLASIPLLFAILAPAACSRN